ncbi:MAG: SGNH/GDSL hydrolase family protein [Oscillospiraceae bacterium]|nr:SGNH/GDSL hydrolase family protein [Oscillospiraceae bacterium]
MELKEFYERFSSDCTAGSAAQVLTRFEKPVERTGRVWYRLSHGGENYALLFTNTVDSTFSDGSVSKANDPGGEWEILSMRVGLCPAWGEEPENWVKVTFDGKGEKTVSSPGPFTTDPIALSAKGGEYLCYEITLRGCVFPYHEEITLSTRMTQDGVTTESRQFPVPVMIGSDRKITKRVGIIGDSITQGCGTEYDSYTHWAAKIAEELPSDVSVWDLGIGYARGYDAATDKGWLARAKTCDEVNVCFGVNDLNRGRTAEELICDLRTIIRSLQAAGCRVTLFTVPPFDQQGSAKENWYAANKVIREELSREADDFFDFAAVLGLPAPDEHRAPFGGHPNAEGCLKAAKAYLARRRG